MLELNRSKVYIIPIIDMHGDKQLINLFYSIIDKNWKLKIKDVLIGLPKKIVVEILNDVMSADNAAIKIVDKYEEFRMDNRIFLKLNNDSDEIMECTRLKTIVDNGLLNNFVAMFGNDILKNAVPVNKKVFEQCKSVYENSLVKMNDLFSVLEICIKEGYTELANWIIEDKQRYFRMLEYGMAKKVKQK